MKKRTKVYFHKATGNIKVLTKSQAKKLPAGWEPIQFVKNDKGQDVMRFNFDGATVDVRETGIKEVQPNGQPIAE